MPGPSAPHRPRRGRGVGGGRRRARPRARPSPLKRRPVVPRPGGVRPVRALPRVLACLTGFAGWEAVAHFGGAGWVQALGDVVGATLVVGLFAPAVACARSRLVVTSMPADTVAGQGCALAVDVSTRVRVQALEPPGPVVCL